MQVDKQNWEMKMNNLHSRKQGISSEHQINYKNLLTNVHIGKTVLDVGCGPMWIRKLLPPDTLYYGIDAFPQNDGIFKGCIEDYDFKDMTFETLFVFAALDGMQDLDKAFANMKRIASKNIIILTGIGINPDIYHTHKITLEYLTEKLCDMQLTYFKQVHPQIVFLEYTKFE